MRIDYAAAVRRMMDMVNEHSYISSNELYERLKDECGWKNVVFVTAAARTLVACGKWGGSEVRGTIRGLYKKTDGAYAGARGSDDELVQSMRRQLEDMERALEREQLALEGARETARQMEHRAEQAEEWARAARQQSTTLEVVVKDGKGKVVRKLEGVFHPQFKRVVALCLARKNVFLYGPTGCGKSHLCEQVAAALGLGFAFVSCTAGMSEGVLGGRLLPLGEGGTFEYVVSEFVKAYEQGGVFLLDEIDAADPNVLLLVNAALANGHVAVSNRPAAPYARRHKDFVCVAAANTYGTGADRTYSGRNRLDAATLDRFQIGKVCLDYDETVERALCPDEALRARLLGYRRAVREHKLERAVSTRFMRDAYDMCHPKESLGLDIEPWGYGDVDEALFAGWREDEVHKVKGGAGA